jgi:SAM-dependent methyltransferase
MLVDSEHTIAAEWKKYTGFTVRPVPSTVSYYETYLQTHPSLQHALLYGSTPEIRSLFQQLQRPLIVFDRSLQMIKAMGLLTSAEKEISKNEKIIQGDWLTMDKLSHGFDLLIGDDAINMVPWHTFNQFISQAHRMLKKGGVFICHLLVKPDDDLIHQTVKDILKSFTQGDIPSVYDLASRLNFCCYDKKTYRMGWQQTIQMLGQQLNYFKPAFDFIELFGQCNSYFYCPPQNDFEVLLHPYFYIDEIFYPREHHYCQFEPIYILKKH